MTSLRDQEKLDGEVAPARAQRDELQQGRGRRADAAVLRRCPHAVPRVRARAARADVGRDLSDDLRHRRAAGLRRTALAALRALARPAGDPRALRAPLPDRRADAAGADGAADRRRAPSIRASRPPNISARPMWISISTSAARRTRTRSRRRRASACRCPTRSCCATARRTSSTSSRATTTPPATTAICGPRCSTPTPSTRSRRRATCSIPRCAKRLRDNIYAAGGARDPSEAYRAFRGRMPSVDALLQKRGLAGA